LWPDGALVRCHLRRDERDESDKGKDDGEEAQFVLLAALLRRLRFGARMHYQQGACHPFNDTLNCVL